jgi:serine/threonine protein kinase/predicted Zn-dependent protease
MLCSACQTPVPIDAAECPNCGVVAHVDPGHTEILDQEAPDSKTAVVDAQAWSKPFTVSDAKAYDSAALNAGSVLGGRYEILKTLGEGGMGSVYKAHDAEVDRIVALKVIRRELAGNADILRRFRQEIVLARQITNRNVVRIYDLGVADGVRFISMEYIEGQELGEMLRQRGKLPAKEAAEIMLQVCRGLSAAHAEGVVHRDLKPENVMIGKQGRAAVMDFGIAASIDAAAIATAKGDAPAETAAHLTRVGALIGTPRYMSPEQARGEGVDRRSDLFAVGLMLYELTMGDLPAGPTTLREILQDRSTSQIRPPIAIDPQMPRALSDIIFRCLQLNPAERFQSADEIVRALEIWLGLRQRHALNWKPLAGMAALILLLVGALIYNLRPKTKVAPGPVKILIADFANHSGNPVLTGTLESALTTALENASFITAYNRGQARSTLAKLSGSTKLDRDSAELIAQREGLGVVVSGSIQKDGDKYALSAQAIDARTRKVLDNITATASTAGELNNAVGEVAGSLRKALGDSTLRSDKMSAAETFSSQSLEASQQYARAQELQWQGKWDEALKAYARSTQSDSGLGRAYAGMAVILANMGRKAEAESYFKQALAKIDRMSDREKYRTRGAYYLLERDYGKAIEQFKALEKQFPADSAGIANLALAYFYERNMPAALEGGQRALAIYPNNLVELNNIGLFALYAGKFDVAIHESQRLLQLNPSFEKAYVCLGLAQLAQGDEAGAAATYAKLETLSKWGASAGKIAQADMSLYKGQFGQAIRQLEASIQTDLTAKDNSQLALKRVMLAEAWLNKSEKGKAVAAAELAANGNSDAYLLYPAAIIFVKAGKNDKALLLARKLQEQFEPDPQAYGKLIEGETQLKAGKIREAINSFQEAQKVANTWLGRYSLGRAYLAAGLYPEADSEFDVCLQRRGEATAVFLDDDPSLRYLPPVFYYQGRARQGLNSSGATESFRTFLAIKHDGENDPLVADAMHRLK